MVKTVKIGEKTYDMKASVLTLETYKRLYDKDLMQMVSKLNKEYSEAMQEDMWISKIQELMLDVLKIAHIMIQEYDHQFMSYEDWVATLDGLLEQPSWIVEVLQIAMSPFRTGLGKK